MASDKKKTEQATEQTEQSVNLAAVKAEIAQMLADAKAEADRIVQEAKAQVSGKAVSRECAETISADRARGEELVEIKLFKDNNKYKEPVFVSCNGETIAIERGVRVRIKRKFAEILDNSEHQDYETAKLIAEKSGKMESLGDM